MKGLAASWLGRAGGGSSRAPRLSVALIAGAMGVIVGAGSLLAAGVVSSPNGPFTGCLSARKGTLYNVAVSPTTPMAACAAGDSTVTFSNAQGPVGPQGPEGPVGPTGAAGATGPQGDPGAIGATGPSGRDGLSPTVTSEPAGANCATGGYAVTDASDHTVYACNGSDGAAGAPGPAGSVGPQGPAGPQGVQGPAGVTTLQGLEGTACTVNAGAGTLAISVDGVTGAVALICQRDPVPPALAVSIPAGTTFRPPDTYGDLAGVVRLEYTYGSLVVTAEDAAGRIDTGFVGAVSLSSTPECQLVVDGGPSYTYTLGDAGTHTFRVTFGSNSAFGAPGPGSAELVARPCVVTAHDQTSAHLDGTSTATALPGEYCDSLDNNGNVAIDEFFPTLGTAVVTSAGSGTWVCSVFDQASIMPSITIPAPHP